MRFNSSLIAAAVAAMIAPAAWATGAQWDSAALGANGSGTSAATAWLTSLSPGSAYAEWNATLSYPTDATPDIAGSGTLTELTGTGFATSGGNIYGFTGPTAFQVDLAGSTGGTWDVYLRVAALGSTVAELATLNGVQASRVVTYTGAATGGFGGAEEESLWKWTLSGNSLWQFNFGASAAHMSLDQVAVYAVQTSVPEPESWALMLVGMAATALARQRRGN